MLWNLPHILSSGFFRRGCQHCPSFGRREERGFVLCFELKGIFRQIPCFSAGSSFLLQGFLPVFYPRILEHKGCAPEVHSFAYLHSVDPFFPEFLRGVMYFLEHCTPRLGPKNFVPFRKIDLEFGGRTSSNTQPSCFEFFSEATEPFPPLFSASC